jgi:hypothetical protein
VHRAVRLAFNPATRDGQNPPDKIAAALDWAARASLPVGALQDPATVRLALGGLGQDLPAKRRSPPSW